MTAAECEKRLNEYPQLKKMLDRQNILLAEHGLKSWALEDLLAVIGIEVTNDNTNSK